MVVQSFKELICGLPAASSGVHLDIGGDLIRLLLNSGATLSGNVVVLADPATRTRPEEPCVSEWQTENLFDVAHLLETIQKISSSRGLASISILQVERWPDIEHLLRGLRDFLIPGTCPIILGTRNLARRDVAVKLLLGCHEPPLEPGVYAPRFTRRTFDALLNDVGLLPSQELDILKSGALTRDESLHPALATNTPLGALLASLRNQADPHAETELFIRTCFPGTTSARVSGKAGDLRPFLSVVMRTQGQRPDCLRDVLLSLAAQSDDDFELIVTGHRVGDEEKRVIDKLLAATPTRLRERTRYLQVNTGSRATPLNAGFEAARGQYIAMLDDDDLVFGHWVETFHDLARTHAGQMLRVVCVAQSTEQIPAVAGGSVARAAGTFERRYSERFDMFQHLASNHTPCMAIAYPRAIFHDLGLRFDDRLHTTEDWDFMMRAALICGVASSPEITAIYRIWSNRTNSQTLHDQELWKTNEVFIKKRLDLSPVLLEPGMLGKIRELVQDSEQLAAITRSLSVRVPGAIGTAHAREVTLLSRFLPDRGIRILRDTVRRLRGNRISADDVRLLENTQLFDADWYLSTYPDVAESGMDPVLHYLRHGAPEGRNPGPLFNGTWYLEQHPDVARSGINPLTHYLKHGIGEGRRIKPLEAHVE